LGEDLPDNPYVKAAVTALLSSLLLAAPTAVPAQFTLATNDGTITIVQYTGPAGAVTIPCMTNGLPVTAIGSNAFFVNYGSSSGVTSVTIPNSVISIGDYAFLACAMTNVTVPGSVTNIGYQAFASSGLISVMIGNNITTVNNGTSIGEQAFIGCSGLTSVTLGNNVTSIGEDAFNGCYGLANVTLGNSVTNIGKYTFAACSLTNITIPGSITSIGYGAFSDCGLTGVYFVGNAPAVGLYSFADNPATAYYLPGTIGWSAFSTNAGLPVVLWNPLIQAGDGGFGVQNNQFGFNITGTNNFTVVVEACTNLTNPVWTPLQTVTLTNGSFHFSDPQWSNYPVRFYGLGLP
jgi:hypothetical protein